MTEVTFQRTAISLLEFENRNLIFSIIELELLSEWQDRERSKIASENIHLHEMLALRSDTQATSTELDIQDWMQGKNDTIFFGLYFLSCFPC